MDQDQSIMRDLGRIEAAQESMQRQITEIKDAIATRDAKIEEMHKIIVGARGGWRAMVVAGGIGAGVVAFIDHIRGLLRAL